MNILGRSLLPLVPVSDDNAQLSEETLSLTQEMLLSLHPEPETADNSVYVFLCVKGKQCEQMSQFPEMTLPLTHTHRHTRRQSVCQLITTAAVLSER